MPRAAARRHIGARFMRCFQSNAEGAVRPDVQTRGRGVRGNRRLGERVRKPLSRKKAWKPIQRGPIISHAKMAKVRN